MRHAQERENERVWELFAPQKWRGFFPAFFLSPSLFLLPALSLSTCQLFAPRTGVGRDLFLLGIIRWALGLHWARCRGDNSLLRESGSCPMKNLWLGQIFFFFHLILFLLEDNVFLSRNVQPCERLIDCFVDSCRWRLHTVSRVAVQIHSFI